MRIGAGNFMSCHASFRTWTTAPLSKASFPWIVGADVWPPQIISMALSFAFEVTVHVYDLKNEGPTIELMRIIERPRSEFVGDLRDVRVLFANKGLHSSLTSEEAANSGMSAAGRC